MIYTDCTFRSDATHVIKTARISALAFALVAATASAQEENASTDSTANTWRESAIARCTEQYSAEQCADPQFLEEHFHVDTLEIAHRAGIRRTMLMNKAVRELTLQRICNNSASDNCANDAHQAQCVAQIEQSCAMLQAEAQTCIANAKQACSNSFDASTCESNQTVLCPSLKKQSIEQLLAKYSKLTDAQKTRLTQIAAELDAKTSGWWSNLIGWLTSPLQ